MRCPRWEPGRRDTGYRKLLLAKGRSWDLYVIDYPVNSYVPLHVDPVPGLKHWRINLRVLGDDAFQGDHVFRFGRIIFFRPDVMAHAVARVRKHRVVISLGWSTEGST